MHDDNTSVGMKRTGNRMRCPVVMNYKIHNVGKKSTTTGRDAQRCDEMFWAGQDTLGKLWDEMFWAG